MVDDLKTWWKARSEKTRSVLRTTALVVGCGYIFYKAGVRDGQVSILKHIEWLGRV